MKNIEHRSVRLDHIYHTISFKNEKIYKIADPMIFSYESNFDEYLKMMKLGEEEKKKKFIYLCPNLF